MISRGWDAAETEVGSFGALRGMIGPSWHHQGAPGWLLQGVGHTSIFVDDSLMFLVSHPEMWSAFVPRAATVQPLHGEHNYLLNNHIRLVFSLLHGTFVLLLFQRLQ